MKEELKALKKMVEDNIDITCIYNQIEESELSDKEKDEAINFINNNGNTLYSNDTFTNYLNEINKFPRLSHEKMIELFKKLKSGDTKVRETLINCNLRLVPYFAKRYYRYNIDIMDIINEGNLGLIRAVDLFDYSLGYRFSNFAFYWIRQAITRYIDLKESKIKVGYTALGEIRRLKRYENILMHNLGRYPTKYELIDYYNKKVEEDNINCKIMTEDLFDNLRMINNPVSYLNTYVGEDEDTELLDLISDDTDSIDTIAINDILAEKLRNLFDSNQIAKMTEREKLVILYRYGFIGEPKSLSQVGEILGLTKERIRQIEHKALRKLRKPLQKIYHM